MTYLDNYADTDIVTGIADGNIDLIERNLYRFELPDSIVISEEMPNRSFALDLTREFFELHLYTRNTDQPQLVKSVVVPFSEGYLYIRETEEENILRLGLTLWDGDPAGDSLTREERLETFVEKYLSDVPFGRYDVFINFFADELGTYNEDEWQISQISDTRREIILERNPADDQPFDFIEYKQFSYDSIFVQDFDTLIRLLFQKGEEQDEYDLLVRDFYERLQGREPELMDNINQSLFIEGLSILFREIYNELDRYIEFEAEQGRHRIVEEDFYEALREIVFNIVSRGIHELPEGRDLFLAE